MIFYKNPLVIIFYVFFLTSAGARLLDPNPDPGTCVPQLQLCSSARLFFDLMKDMPHSSPLSTQSQVPEYFFNFFFYTAAAKIIAP